MAKRKTTEAQAEITPDALPQEAAATATEQPTEQSLHPPPNGNGRRPEVSWALHSDRTTRIEVSAWINLYTNQQGEQYEQVSFTVQRSYRDQQNQWQRGGAWRTHDLPVLIFLLLQKAHAWALERRTLDSSMPL